MKRKEFLYLLGAGAAGWSARPWARAGARAATRPSARKNWTWIGGDLESLDAWKRLLARARSAGIDAVLLNGGEAVLRKVIPVAREEGVEVHAWMITMMEGGYEEEHPEWYAVNRNGESTATDPPYVDYYKFMCPSREAVQQHKLARARRLVEIDGVESLHLDYIRYPDVILPVALWEKYDLVQEREQPRFDYCYCEVCRQTFEARTGLDPLALEDPPSNRAWLQYRYDSIVHVVNQLSELARSRDKQITAAVFPTPAIARALVRQDWPRWPMDALHPMIYHSFYEEDVAWIEEATRQGVTALGGRFPLYAGLFVPELSPRELAEAVRRAFAGGASGVSLFEGTGVSEEHWNTLAAVLNA